MGAGELNLKVVWFKRDANGETCDGCGDPCYLGIVRKSFLRIVEGEKAHKLPFTLCPDCFNEYKKLD